MCSYCEGDNNVDLGVSCFVYRCQVHKVRKEIFKSEQNACLLILLIIELQNSCNLNSDALDQQINLIIKKNHKKQCDQLVESAHQSPAQRRVPAGSC